MAALSSLALTTFLVALLARAAWHKAQTFHESIGFAHGYALVDEARVAPILRALIAAEALAVALLIVPATRVAGGLLAAGLFAGYAVLMALALRDGRSRIECGCGGPPQVVSGWTLGRNAVLVALSLAVTILPAMPVGAAGAALALVAGLGFWAIYAVAERLASHIPHINPVG